MARSTDLDVALFQALADPTRLGIVRQLATEEEVCACDFTACCDVAQPTVSHHLKVLRDAGWIKGERRGRWIWYSIRYMDDSNHTLNIYLHFDFTWLTRPMIPN